MAVLSSGAGDIAGIGVAAAVLEVDAVHANAAATKKAALPGDLRYFMSPPFRDKAV